MSQICFYLSLSSNFINNKTGNFWSFFKLNVLDIIKHELRHKSKICSLDMIMNYTQTKFQAFSMNSKRDIYVQNVLAKNRNLQFLALPHYHT